MKTCKCPGCAELVHFDGGCVIQRCWNCNEFIDCRRFVTWQEKCAEWLRARLDFKISSLPRVTRRSRLVIAALLPVMVCMLLICNSLDIAVVRDADRPFQMQQSAHAPFGSDRGYSNTGCLDCLQIQ